MERNCFDRGSVVLFVCAFLVACLMADSTAGGQPDGAARAKAIQLFSASPAAFIGNTGQIDDPSIRFVFNGSGANVYHTTSGPVFHVFQRTESSAVGPAVGADLPSLRGNRPPYAPSAQASLSFSATFPGAKKNDPAGEQPQQATVN